MAELESHELEQASQNLYGEIKKSIVYAENNITKAVNTGMVNLYWGIGYQIDKVCDGKQAGYGKGVLQHVSDKLIAEFGKTYSVRNLQMMRQFYVAFPNVNTLCSHLSWSRMSIIINRT